MLYRVVGNVVTRKMFSLEIEGDLTDSVSGAPEDIPSIIDGIGEAMKMGIGDELKITHIEPAARRQENA